MKLQVSVVCCSKKQESNNFTHYSNEEGQGATVRKGGGLFLKMSFYSKLTFNRTKT